jgi:hypothetical protein
VTEQVPLLVGVGPLNAEYLATKRDKMGHKFTLGTVVPGGGPLDEALERLTTGAAHGAGKERA